MQYQGRQVLSAAVVVHGRAGVRHGFAHSGISTGASSGTGRVWKGPSGATEATAGRSAEQSRVEQSRRG